MREPLGVALLGTGYVADFYAATFPGHPGLALRGAWDAHPGNLEAFLRRWPTRRYGGLEEMLGDPAVGLVVNLTNPRVHFELNRRCLEAGKHVYSEKPLAMAPGEARTLLDLAAGRGVMLSSAPCSVLGGTAQTLWREIRRGSVGRVRLIYANFDDGMIAPVMQPWKWTNSFGVPWPAKDEFEVGCTYEHAGYVLTWLAAFFGPARCVTSFASCRLPEKGIPVEGMAPDFTVGCIEYGDGVVARVTCGLVAPRDKSLHVFGDEGTIHTATVRDDAAPVYLRRHTGSRMRSAAERRLRPLRGFMERVLPTVPWSGQEWLLRKRVSPARPPEGSKASRKKRVDFLRGPADMADALAGCRKPRLSGELGLHVVEIIEALQYPERHGYRREIRSDFPPILPEEWAR